MPKRRRREVRAARKQIRVSLRPFYEASAIDLLMARVSGAATSHAERLAFSAILRRAYEDALDLEILYQDLPGVFAGDHGATDSFRGVLERGAGLPAPPGMPATPPAGYTPIPDGGGMPCPPRFFIRPDRVLYITQGAATVAQGDATVLGVYLQAITNFWDRARWLDRLYRSALDGVDGTGRDRLGEMLRVVWRDVRPPDSGFFPVPDGPWPPGPDDGPPWPPPPDGPPLDWPPKGPGGPPGLPMDPCEFHFDLCRRLVAAGAAQLGPMPPESTYITGITGIAPATACAGETVTIHGTGFPPTQPANVTVVIGSTVMPVVSWASTAIVIRIPAGTKAGCVAFRNETLEGERQKVYHRNEDARAQMAEGLACLGLPPPPLESLPYRASKAPCFGFNYFAGTLPEIDSFLVNGLDSLAVQPNTVLTASWQVRNATTIRIRRSSPNGPFVDVTNPPGNAFTIGPFTGNQPVDAVYELTATNRCGVVTATVDVRLRRIPKLVIEGMEVTQGIQVFWRPGVAWNSLPSIGGKDTIVRVYVSVDMLGFMNDQLPNVTGTLTVGGTKLTPINGITPTTAAGNPFITARRRDQIDRTQTNHTLNFRIPAALANGSRTLNARVVAPVVESVTPTAVQFLSWTWTNETALPVRYVRVRDSRPAPAGTGTMPTDAQARFTVDRAFDLMPSPPTNIAAAWLPTWATTSNFAAAAGPSGLLAELDDQHDCSAWEWLWAWTGLTDCPDDDHAYWVGVTTPFNRGLAGTPGNTAVACIHLVANGQADIPRTTPAHEIAHNLGLLHVNRACGAATVGGPFYTHPNNGNLLDVPFDPFYNVALAGSVQDFMSYGCTVWTSGDSWTRLQGTF